MSEIHLENIASEVIGTPLLMLPAKLDNILGWLGPRLLSGVDWSAAIQAETVEHRNNADYIVADGVAIVPLIGSLVHRGSSMNSSGITAYQAFDRNLTLAENDPSVNSILLDVDSGGGQVAGMFNQAKRVLGMRKNKKVVAVSNELAASAAYGIACSASEFVVTETARAGSIGVVLAHVDYSKQLESAGVAVTYVYAGDHKVDGNPYQALPETVKADLQAEIDGIYGLFTSHVATARDISVKRVIDTQARVFTGENAVSAGLADRVSTFEAEFERLRSQGGAPSGRIYSATTSSSACTDIKTDDSNEDIKMNEEEMAAAIDAAVSAAVVTASAEATAAERTRCMSIMDSAAELGVSNDIAKKMMNTENSAEAATDLMLSLKESMDEQTATVAGHSAGATPDAEPAAMSAAEIYAKRNAR